MLKRVFLFLATNLAVIVVLGAVMNLLGIDHYLQESGAGLNYESLLIFSLLFGFAGSFISLAMSKWMAKRATGAQVIETPRNNTEAWLLAKVDELSRRAGIRTPEVAIYPSSDMNAFATGANRDASLVAVSTGLLQGMRQDEVEAVLAHEVSHIANGDMVTLALVQGVLNTFVIFFSRIVGSIVDQAILKNERGRGIGYFVTVIAAEIVFGLLASIIVMRVSRHREFRADAGSAALNGKSSMINALRRLQHGSATPLPDSMEAFGISGRRSPMGLRRLFMSHPPIEERIAALQKLG